MESIAKVVIYLVHRGHLLVFIHPDAPEAGLQVPAGSVEPRGHPLTAARRELEEETGIKAATLQPLGTARYDMSTHGRNEIHERSFFPSECSSRSRAQGIRPFDRGTSSPVSRAPRF